MYPTSEESRKPLWSKRIRKLFLSSFIVCCSRKAKKLLSKNPSQTLPVVSSSEEETRAGHLINTCSEFEPTENSRLTNEWNLEAPYQGQGCYQISNMTPSLQNCQEVHVTRESIAMKPIHGPLKKTFLLQSAMLIFKLFHKVVTLTSVSEC